MPAMICTTSLKPVAALFQAQNRPHSISKARCQRQKCEKREPNSLSCIKSRGRPRKYWGSLGPCALCETNDCFNYFNSRTKQGRRYNSDQSTIQWRQKRVLDSFLFVMRFADVELLDELRNTIREDRMGSSTIHCIWKNVMILQKRDIRLDYNLNGEILFPRPGRDVDASKTMPLSDQTGSAKLRTEQSTCCVVVQPFAIPVVEFQVHEAVTPISGDAACKEFGASHVYASVEVPSCSRLGEEGPAKLQQHNTILAAHDGLKYTASVQKSLTEFTAILPKHTSYEFIPRRVLDIPFLEPITDFSNFCVDLRNNGREALANGVELGFLSNWGRMDCDLLFRDRIEEDNWNVPNWACETSRRFPAMHPATRIAFALCLYRTMLFLIAPSEKTLSQLPHLLRPTDDQMEIPHDITFSFVPSPRMRSSLVHKPADWLTILALNNFKLDWTSDWGDIGGATMSEAGSWQYQRQVLFRENLESTACIWGFDPHLKVSDKAIVYDTDSGKRYISDEFERHCWTQENWSISKNILNSWPELEGYITTF